MVDSAPLQGHKFRGFIVSRRTAMRLTLAGDTVSPFSLRWFDMNDLDLFTEQEKTMTVLQLADALNVSRDLIEKRTNELFPDKMQKGKTTLFNEQEATVIKLRIQQNSSLATSDNRRRLEEMPRTDLEKELLIAQAMQFQQEKITRLQREIAEKDEKIFLDAPKVQSYEILMKTTDHRSISNACKHFGIKPIAVGFPYLRDHGYLTLKDLPTQKAINEGIMSLKENASTLSGKSFQQAVVQANQLEKFGKVISKAVNND
jgi:phage antirepressor YoqD-like protein